MKILVLLLPAAWTDVIQSFLWSNQCPAWNFFSYEQLLDEKRQNKVKKCDFYSTGLSPEVKEDYDCQERGVKAVCLVIKLSEFI